MLKAETLRWTIVSQDRLRCPHRFDLWLAIAFDDPREVLGDPAAAASQAAVFRRWDADPADRHDPANQRRMVTTIAPRHANDDLRSVRELFEFMTTNTAESCRALRSLGAPRCGHRTRTRSKINAPDL